MSCTFIDFATASSVNPVSIDYRTKASSSANSADRCAFVLSKTLGRIPLGLMHTCMNRVQPATSCPARGSPLHASVKHMEQVERSCE